MHDIECLMLLGLHLQEAKREEIEQQIALASTPNRRDDRRDDRDRKRSRDNRGPPMSEDGWNTVASTKNRASFDSSRLKNTFINRVRFVSLWTFCVWTYECANKYLRSHCYFC